MRMIRTVLLIGIITPVAAVADPASPDISAAPPAADAADAPFRELLASHRERTAIPFIVDDIGFAGDPKLRRTLQERRVALSDRVKDLEDAIRKAAEEGLGAGRLADFLKTLDGMDLVAFHPVCEALARERSRLPAGVAAALDAQLARIREARSKFASKESQVSYVAAVRAELKTQELYRDAPEPRAAGGKAGGGRTDGPYVPPTFKAEWSNPVEHWGGPERGSGGPAAHAFVMDELISDKGRARYEKLSGRKVVYPSRADIVKAVRTEVARQATPDVLADTDVKLERLQDVAVGLSQCESGVSQFFGKGREFEGKSMEGYPVVYLKPDSISWANVIGCCQISCYWWCRSLDEGVHIAWDYKYNVYKGVTEVVKHVQNFKKELKGDALLGRVANRFSNGDWERMRKYLAEPEKWLR